MLLDKIQVAEKVGSEHIKILTVNPLTSTQTVKVVHVLMLIVVGFVPVRDWHFILFCCIT
jgi:hypothetical protein